METPTTSIEDHLVRINADFYLPIEHEYEQYR